MDFTLENFDFKVGTLTTVAEIDQLLEEQAFKSKDLKLNEATASCNPTNGRFFHAFESDQHK